VLENPNVDTIIPGITSFEQLAEDVAIMGMKMGFEDHDTLDRFGEYIHGHYAAVSPDAPAARASVPMCQTERPEPLPGYAYGYGDIGLAWEQ